MAAYHAGSSWLAKAQNRAQPVGFEFGRDEPYRVLMLSSPEPYAIVAAVAAGFAVVLAVSWLKPTQDEW